MNRLPFRITSTNYRARKEDGLEFREVAIRRSRILRKIPVFFLTPRPKMKLLKSFLTHE